MGSRVGAVVRALASHQCVPASIPGPGVMWVEFVVGSLLCSERFFSGSSGFPLSSKTNISKFQFDPDVGHFSHEPLARVIAQALPVLDAKFHLHLQLFTFYKWHWNKCLFMHIHTSHCLFFFRMTFLQKPLAAIRRSEPWLLDSGIKLTKMN